MLYRMLQVHESGPQWPYNEVVIDAQQMVIEAVFVGAGADAPAMHSKLLAHYGLLPAQLPLLVYRGGARDPFVLAASAGR